MRKDSPDHLVVMRALSLAEENFARYAVRSMRAWYYYSEQVLTTIEPAECTLHIGQKLVCFQQNQQLVYHQNIIISRVLPSVHGGHI